MSLTGASAATPVGMMAIVLGAALGSYYTQDTVAYYYDLIWDGDGNGTSDLIDRFFYYVGGANENQFDHFVTWVQGGNKIDLVKLKDLSPEQLLINAKNNIAWRYALMNLTPMIMDGADFSLFNKNGELDYENMTPQFWQHRAEMLY